MTGKGSRIIFVIGGARSGKSSFALSSASALRGSKAYIATAQALDGEMAERIRKHKEERPEEWSTLEEPLKVAGLLKNIRSSYDVVLIDCLTLWLSNVLLGNEEGLTDTIDEFISALRECTAASVYIVSNEVGLGLVPDNALARKFRDISGELNQRVAGIADEVYLVVAGMPLKIK
ncbi:MAG: bifunctional adenosylcobinamide kinase/adenosylcobinamide-phosphate guanylyltransferase [Nitrospirae bacterium]|nr:bifunctional adenosylcobinamide kinase/adenosylcobinamide-phosphate guanylyltransferase [Nitrospirota bacterium]MCL5238777.1 bifunctional adenosylcobinamide kinase/adenosylcobinamide-phosphate guanylyltransferase [Nitrospirota bacterium]